MKKSLILTWQIYLRVSRAAVAAINVIDTNGIWSFQVDNTIINYHWKETLSICLINIKIYESNNIYDINLI